MERITATDANRKFSDVLNRVKYQGATFEIERAGEIVARLIPALPSKGIAVSELNGLFARLPSLGEDAETFTRDLKEIRAYR